MCNSVHLWLKRFHAHGLVWLVYYPHSGRLATYTRSNVGVIVATALTGPQTLNLPFQVWMLDRLVAYLSDKHEITM